MRRKAMKNEYLVFSGGHETGDRGISLVMNDHGVWLKSDESDEEQTYWYFYPHRTIDTITHIRSKNDD